MWDARHVSCVSVFQHDERWASVRRVSYIVKWATHICTCLRLRCNMWRNVRDACSVRLLSSLVRVSALVFWRSDISYLVPLLEMLLSTTSSSACCVKSLILKWVSLSSFFYTTCLGTPSSTIPRGSLQENNKSTSGKTLIDKAQAMVDS
jgi:hypothetical protein